MKKNVYTVEQNTQITPRAMKMVLSGDTEALTAPGQFINIKLDGLFLRRPISVCDWDDFTVTICYKVVGAGTEMMSAMSKGEKLDVLTGLGNGFDISKAVPGCLVIGGGIGSAPMYGLAKRIAARKIPFSVSLGFDSAEDAFHVDEFRALTPSVNVATADGSLGKHGFVTDALPDDYSYFFACGREEMLRVIYKATRGEGQMSFEERMGCGFGACMGCSCRTVSGPKRICKDGPVLTKEEIIWED